MDQHTKNTANQTMQSPWQNEKKETSATIPQIIASEHIK